MFKLTQTASALGIAAVLAAAPLAAVAQTAPADPPVTDAPAEGDIATDAGTDAAPARPVAGIIQMQAAGTVLASDLIGSSVYNMADENIGNVDDLVMTGDGTVEGVVIGVGGFLGIGKKHVAVDMAEIVVEPDASGAPRLRLDTPREALESAPEFVTAAAQQREADSLDVDRVEPTGGMTVQPGTDAPQLPADE